MMNLILEELNKEMKKEIRKNTQKKLNDAEEASLIERGSEEASASFRKLIKKNKEDNAEV